MPLTAVRVGRGIVRCTIGAVIDLALWRDIRNATSDL